MGANSEQEETEANGERKTLCFLRYLLFTSMVLFGNLASELLEPNSVRRLESGHKSYLSPSAELTA